VSLSTRQALWLALAWLGVAQAVEWALAIREIGVWPGNAAALAGSTLLVLVAAAGVARPGLVGGPTERTGVWWGAIAGAVLATIALVL
jgi:hypothetical protein